MTKPTIEVHDVVRHYGSVRAVDGISFQVNQGEVVGLLGPNGAGKTTTLRMLATLIAPDRGRVSVAGHDAVEEPLKVRASLGYQTGDTGIYGRLTPTEFLRYFGQLHHIPKLTLDDRIRTLVAQFGIDEFDDRLCGNLSTGQKQRVSLARTLLHNPPVVVLDEPTSGLDLVSSQFILDQMRSLADQGHAVLFSTHIMGEVELICDRVVLINRGVVIARGSVDDLKSAAGASSLSRAFLDLVQRDDKERAT
jgi:sodium transport system ATP-binding protein